MSSIFTTAQSSIFEVLEPSEAPDEPSGNSKSLKTISQNEEFIEDESTNSETCSDINQEDDDLSISSKHEIEEL